MRPFSLRLLALVMLVGSFFCTGLFGQLVVSKAVTRIDINNDGQFETGDPAVIAAFLANVPNSRAIAFGITFTVEAVGDDVEDVVVTDRFGAELDLTCFLASPGTVCNVINNKSADIVAWDIGPLANGSFATLRVLAVTNVDSGGNQRYTACGLHELNSGPTAKGFVEKENGKGLKQVSSDGNQILLNVSGLFDAIFPQCGNCMDDDGDGLTDIEDPDCIDSEDDDESL